MTKDEASDILTKVENIFCKGMAPLLPVQVPEDRIIKLTPGTDTFVQLKQTNEKDSNSAIEIIYQFDLRNTREHVICELLAQILNQPFFEQLRTKEQLGYIVFSRTRRDHNVESLSLLIQSATKSPDFILERSDEFFNGFYEALIRLDDDVVNTHIKSLTAKILEKDKKMKVQTIRYWKEINYRVYKFNRGINCSFI